MTTSEPPVDRPPAQPPAGALMDPEDPARKAHTPTTPPGSSADSPPSAGAADQPAAERPIPEQPAAERPASDQPMSDQPMSDQRASDQRASDQWASERLDAEPGAAASPDSPAPPDSPARELRVAVTVADFDAAVRFYRDALGLPVIEAWDHPHDRRGVILAAGQATLELLSTAQTQLVDQVETATPQADAAQSTDGAQRGGSAPLPADELRGGADPGRVRPAPPVRLAIEVDDSAAAAEALVASGAEHLGGPVVTPWQHRNVRLLAPDGMQLTLFTVLDTDPGADPSEGSTP
jgi:lactoylglutathione lyase